MFQLIFLSNWRIISSIMLVRNDTAQFMDSFYPFYIVTYYIKWVTTSWTDGNLKNQSSNNQGRPPDFGQGGANFLETMILMKFRENI